MDLMSSVLDELSPFDEAEHKKNHLFDETKLLLKLFINGLYDINEVLGK